MSLRSLLEFCICIPIVLACYYSIHYTNEYPTNYGHAFYNFNLWSAITSIIGGLILLLNRNTSNKIFWNSTSIILLLYFIFHVFTLWVNEIGVVNYGTINLVSNLLFFIGILIIYKSNFLNITILGVLFLMLGAYESIYSILQYVQIIDIPSLYFKATGSSFNPNISGMFIAMCIPFLHLLIQKRSIYYKLIALTMFTIYCIALTALSCRSALLGCLVALVFYTLNELYVFKFGNGINLRKILAVGISIGTIGISAMVLSNFEIDSTNGRKLIWKIAFEEFKEKPIVGHGFYQFERVYNLRQSSYFANGRGSSTEIKNARHVWLAHNDILQHLFEGGIPGLLLFFGLFLIPLRRWLLYSPELDLASYIGILGILLFFILGLTNSAQRTIPIFGFFILYLSLSSLSYEENNNFSQQT